MCVWYQSNIDIEFRDLLQIDDNDGPFRNVLESTRIGIFMPKQCPNELHAEMN